MSEYYKKILRTFIIMTKIASLIIGGVLIGHTFYLQINYPPRFLGEAIWLFMQVVIAIFFIVYGFSKKN